MLPVRHLRGLHPDAHMRSLRIVEVDYPYQGDLAFLSGRQLHLVQPLHLEDAVCPFGNGILQGVSALGHADCDPMFPQFRHILIAAVPAAPVRVVDKLTGLRFAYALQGHPRGLQRVDGLKGRPHGPADDLVGICVRYQRQIVHALLGLHVRYICNPDFIGP